MTIALAKQLSEHLDKNMNGYRAYLATLDKGVIVAMSQATTLMEDVHRRLSEMDFFTEEALFLLKMESPLTVITEAWMPFADNEDVRFVDFLEAFLDIHVEKGGIALLSDDDEDEDEDENTGDENESGDASDDEIVNAVLDFIGQFLKGVQMLMDVIHERQDASFEDGE